MAEQPIIFFQHQHIATSKFCSLATAKLAIFLQNILWESCSKFNLEQLSHSMFCKNIARLASIQGTPVSIATAKRAIFLQNILWESCSKFNSKQYSNSIFGQNIDSLAVARENILP